ncbi:class I SAM-dependent methyltransferase [Aminobacter sp. P9b]|uniref:hypothetical protein n=1 Tax=Aminobacter sp. P9b TaxID=3133697 RepID=UPI003255F7C2
MGIRTKLRIWFGRNVKGENAPNFRSADYWDRRYRKGGNSGAGSYGRLAEFKAEILNSFVAEHGIQTIVEHGCGDGAQLDLARYPSYLGLDVSSTIVEICRERFKDDATKRFSVVGDEASSRYDLALSLDVIYHLVEDAVYEEYMRGLLNSSHRFVAIYASNEDRLTNDIHVRHRRFTDTIAATNEWQLIRHIPNRYPYDRRNRGNTSFADFYIFERATK